MYSDVDELESEDGAESSGLQQRVGGAPADCQEGDHSYRSVKTDLELQILPSLLPVCRHPQHQGGLWSFRQLQLSLSRWQTVRGDKETSWDASDGGMMKPFRASFIKPLYFYDLFYIFL